jgi:hypothetical protein
MDFGLSAGILAAGPVRTLYASCASRPQAAPPVTTPAPHLMRGRSSRAPTAAATPPGPLTPPAKSTRRRRRTALSRPFGAHRSSRAEARPSKLARLDHDEATIVGCRCRSGTASWGYPSSNGVTPSSPLWRDPQLRELWRWHRGVRPRLGARPLSPPFFGLCGTGLALLKGRSHGPLSAGGDRGRVDL